MAEPDAATADALAWYTGFRALVSRRLHALVELRAGGVYDLCRYHLGWADERGRPADADTSKMLRPVLCLAACNGYGEPARAVGIAAALELLHAFSLVHDDIEDGDRERRHRPTVWAQFGVPLAVNAGDALFAQACAALHESAMDLERERAVQALRLFSEACLRMIEGQHLDIEFEARPTVSVAEYVEMARGKTGAVIGAALALGGVCGGATPAQVELLRDAGVELGLAFQATDDVLAFWGDPAETGKAVGNDLRRGKKSLPVALAEESDLSVDRLRALPLGDVLAELERVGSRKRTEQFALERAASARRLIKSAGVSDDGEQQLASLIDFSVSRVH